MVIDAYDMDMFRSLLATGAFYMGILAFPENLSTTDRPDFQYVVTSAHKIVKGFAIITLQENFAEYASNSSGVIQTFLCGEENPLELVNFIDQCLVASPPHLEHFFDEFPPEVATACEQYLLVFRDFLSEIGIGATTNIAHDAGKLLFSVVPNDPNEALDDIRQALEIYLRLPAVTEGMVASPTDDIAILRLQAQIDHLRSQFRFALMTMQPQQETEAQQITTPILKGADPAINFFLIPSQSSQENRIPNEEAVCGGLIKFGDFDIGKGGIKIGLAELVRKIKHWMASKREQNG